MLSGIFDYRSIFDYSPIAICILKNGIIQLLNPKMTQLTGYTEEELLYLHVDKLVDKSNCDLINSLINNKVPNECEFRLINRQGEVKYCKAFFSQINYNGYSSVLCQSLDITEQKKAAQLYQASEIRFKELADFLPEVVFEIDVNGILTYCNKNAYQFFGYTREDFENGFNVLKVITPEDRNRAKDDIKQALSKELGGSEYVAQRKDGSKFPVLMHSSPIIRGGQTVGLRGFIIDITHRKKAEEQMRYLSMHDPLTGLYNRTYFNHKIQDVKEKGQYPVGLIICDVDGLKLVNDGLGHSIGDNLLLAAAQVIKNSFREDDLIARIGGDEFAIILPHCHDSVVKNACQRISNALILYNAEHSELPLSISVGYAVSDNDISKIEDLFKEADNNMYRQKLYQGRTNRNTIMQTLMKALEEKDFIAEGHAKRLQRLVTALAKAVNLPQRKISGLGFLAQFHDIGKVGIPDKILFKKRYLTRQETMEMQRHSEIGHRIALSSPELAPIADWILKHHEWWNGKGYPLGLKEDEIPLECRILAVADAYDAMTNKRPYREVLSPREAIDELQKKAGIQFDPQLVPKFIEVILKL